MSIFTRITVADREKKGCKSKREKKKKKNPLHTNKNKTPKLFPQRRKIESTHRVQSGFLRRTLVEKPLRHVAGLVAPISRAPGGLLQQQRRQSQRPGRGGPNMEHEIQKDDARIHFPLSECRSDGEIRTIPSQSDIGGHLFGPDRPVGQPGAEAHPHTEDAAVRHRPYGQWAWI